MSKDVTPLLDEIASAVTRNKRQSANDRRQSNENTLNVDNKGSIYVGGHVFVGQLPVDAAYPPLSVHGNSNLIKCPDCSAIVSKRSSSCKRCGLDVAKYFFDLGEYKHAKSIIHRATKVRNLMLTVSLGVSVFYGFGINMGTDIVSSLILGLLLLFCAPAAYALELTRSKFEKQLFRSQFYRAGDEKH